MRSNTRLVIGFGVLLLVARCANVEWGNAPAASPTPVASASAASSVEMRPDPDLERALAAIKANDFKGAKGILEKSLQANPKGGPALYYMAICLENLDDKKGAEQKYKEALQTIPEAAINLGALYLEEKRWDDAATVTQSALAKKANDPELHTNLAVALAGKGDKKGGLTHYQEALKGAANSAEIRYGYASLLLETGDRENAVKEAKTALAAAGNKRSLIGAIGRMLGSSDAGAYSDCIAAFDKAIAIGDDPDLRVRRGMCRFVLKDDKAARADFEAALSQNPNYGPAHFYLGESLMASGDAEKAVKEFEAASSDPSLGQKAQERVGEARKAAAKRKKGKK